jgi:HD-GYP domain-containing protein (c-di-GMP phosphodiesterase class II)
MTMLKRIPTDQLRLGMFLHELCGPWMDHPFWRMKFLLKDAADIRRLSQSGITEVWIDTSRGLDVPGGLTQEQVDEEVERSLQGAITAPLMVPVPLNQMPPATSRDEFAQAVKLRDKAMRRVQSLYSEARMGKALHTEGCAQAVNDIIGSVARHRGALISLLRLKSQDEYTYLHSVSVCTLMVALGRTLGLSGVELHEVGLAGMLHDIGKVKISLLVLNKPDKLTESEFALMKKHPTWGHEILLYNRTASPIAIDVCLRHHEKVDGTGYPGGLKGDAISLYAKMGAVCDVYDAVTSVRSYKSAWRPADAVRQMAQWKGHFDPAVFQAFIKTVGIHPIGSLVRLKSGRLGVVCDQSGESLLRPKVKVFFSALTKERIKPVVVDLSAEGEADAIAGIESAEAWNFKHVDRLWLEEAGLAELYLG